MEKCLPFKSFIRALFFLALLFIMYDPPEIHSQCVDVSSSPCFVNVSVIPYEMFEGTVYGLRTKEFFEKIREESIYADTCNGDWEHGDLYLFYKNLYFTFSSDMSNYDYHIGDIFTIDDLKDTYNEEKEILKEIEKISCKFHFEIIYKEDSYYFAKLIFEKHVLQLIIWEFFVNKEPTYDFDYHGGFTVHYLFTDVKDKQNPNIVNLVCKYDKLYIETIEILFDEKITIYDYLGTKQIESTIKSNLTNIDISSLSRGIYFVKINNKIYKFMKE